MKLCLTSSAPMKNASARDCFQASKVAAGDGSGSQSLSRLLYDQSTGTLAGGTAMLLSSCQVNVFVGL